jgi:hypothetical protein
VRGDDGAHARCSLAPLGNVFVEVVFVLHRQERDLALGQWKRSTFGKGLIEVVTMRAIVGAQLEIRMLKGSRSLRVIREFLVCGCCGWFEAVECRRRMSPGSNWIARPSRTSVSQYWRERRKDRRSIEGFNSWFQTEICICKESVPLWRAVVRWALNPCCAECACRFDFGNEELQDNS